VSGADEASEDSAEKPAENVAEEAAQPATASAPASAPFSTAPTAQSWRPVPPTSGSQSPADTTDAAAVEDV